jgi:hypothetical protein
MGSDKVIHQLRAQAEGAADGKGIGKIRGSDIRRQTVKNSRRGGIAGE